jgi:hypothetical protein
MDNTELLNESRILLKKSARLVAKKLELLLEKDPLNSFIPEQLAVCYKILGNWEKSREMSALSQKIEEKLMHGSPRPTKTEDTSRKPENLDHPLLAKGFAEGFFSGLTHPVAFCHHVDSFKDVLREPRFVSRFINIFGRFLGGFPSACGLVYSFTRFSDDPRFMLPLGLSLVATNSASAYRFLCKSISFNFNELDDDSLVGFYKAFKGDFESAYTIFKRKKDRTRLSMIGDFYLDEAETDTKMLKKKGLLNTHIMNVLMRKSMEIYTKVNDPSNVRRIASDYSNLGFTDFAEDSWRTYYELKNESEKNSIIFGNNNPKPIYHLSPELRDILVKECEKMCKVRYKGRSAKVPYSPRREEKLFKALHLMDNWKGQRDVAYFMLKAQIYRLLGFKKSAEKCESAVQSIEINRITIEEKARTLKRLRKLNIHANPMAKLNQMKSMEIRGYLSEEAVNFLNR